MLQVETLQLGVKATKMGAAGANFTLGAHITGVNITGGQSHKMGSRCEKNGAHKATTKKRGVKEALMHSFISWRINGAMEKKLQRSDAR